VVFRQQGQGPVHELDILAAGHPKIGTVTIELRFGTGVLSGLVERLMILATSTTGQSKIERDPVEPREKSAVALEGIKLEIRLDECLLNDIFGLVGIANDADHGRIETVLVAKHQGFKGRTLPIECPLNQFVFVVHSLDQKEKGWVSGKGVGSGPAKIMNYI